MVHPHSNDSALDEGKNGQVVRKCLGHDHIPRWFAGLVDNFIQHHLSLFLNHRRPCLFPVEYRYPHTRNPVPLSAPQRRPVPRDPQALYNAPVLP